MYLDPPYVQQKRSMYHGRIDFDRFFRWLGGQRARYLLSLNGFVGDEDRRMDVPQWHFDEYTQVGTGRSPCRRLAGQDALLVSDGLYVRRNERGRNPDSRMLEMWNCGRQ